VVAASDNVSVDNSNVLRPNCYPNPSPSQPLLSYKTNNRICTTMAWSTAQYICAEINSMPQVYQSLATATKYRLAATRRTVRAHACANAVILNFFPLCSPNSSTILGSVVVFSQSRNGKDTSITSWIQMLIRITTEI